jgi:hypothetical protein
MDEISPVTGGPYGSPEEYTWTAGLGEQQRDYLRNLVRARQIEPDPNADGDIAPDRLPATLLGTRDEPESRCFAVPVLRKGGHPRHDAYATKVTGSVMDYFVKTPLNLAINYDGLGVGTRNVWEVKTGFGWFFNAKSAGLTAITLARWDAQKDLGLTVAGSCGYVHLWAHPDKYVAQLLLARWGGAPPVLNIAESR